MTVNAVTMLMLLPLLAGPPADAQTPPPDSFQTQARHVNRAAFWERSKRDVLAGFGNMYHATVLQTEDAEYPFRMWFFGWAAADCNPGFPGCDAIFHARGKTLDTWEVYCGKNTWDATQSPARWVPVIAAQDKPYDAWHNGDPSVVFHEGRYYMAYSSTGPNTDGIQFGQPGDSDGDLYCVMGAVSNDGIEWTRTLEPLLIHAPEIGAPRDPKTDAFVHGMYHRPSLLFDQGKWRLWFDYWTGSSVAMGYAEAEADKFVNGRFTVLRAGDDPLLPEWPNPAVVKVGETYLSLADPSGYGQGWPGRQLAEAESADGIHWRIRGWIPPDPDTPACHVPSPVLVQDGPKRWLAVFYACQIGGEPYDYRYNRIRYMRKAVP
ncbi:MAG: hypothetical protein QG656_125 [Candidatus Hydrogenedentes bacterium]|nr:hypothetical protein [Candidatus Hydrogenedentota bacterium]